MRSSGHSETDVPATSDSAPIAVAVVGPTIEVTDVTPEEPIPESASYSGVPAPGSVIGDTYTVLQELGRGGMGVVLLARDETLHRLVALKLVRPEVTEPDVAELFLREAQTMACINHPNVLCVHAFGQHRNQPYFVAEYVQGETLEEWLLRHRQQPDLPRAAQILRDVCKGVEAIHQAGAVHRDLKPGNILLDGDCRVRVADFGISTFQTREARQQDLTAAGTPAYMAPEARLGSSPTLTPKSDIYALGCIAYETLTGQHPHAGPNGVHTPLPGRHQPVVRPSQVRSSVPTAFDPVLLTALDPDPERRFGSAAAFEAALAEAARGFEEPHRILLAEDDDDFRELLAEALAHEFPYSHIEAVGSGRAALDAALKAKPSVVLVDLQMPGVDGVSVTTALRSEPTADDVPILVLTGEGGARDWARLSTLGADGFLLKPFAIQDLGSLVRRAIRERASFNPR